MKTGTEPFQEVKLRAAAGADEVTRISSQM